MIRVTTLLMLSGVVLSGCATRTGLPPNISQEHYCRIARPITWELLDTRVTKEQIDAHNRLWAKLCRGKK